MVIYVFLDENDCPYYVGQTNNFRERKQEHERYINNENLINTYRYNLYKYKKARKLKRNGHPFEMTVIDTAKNRKDLLDLEIYYIKKFKSLGIKLCNITEGGDMPPSRKGKKLSEETCKRISKSKSGKNHPFYGKKFSVEHRNNISKGKMGVKFSDIHKKNLSIIRRKRKITYKTRQKTSRTSTGRINIKIYKLIDKDRNEYITTHGLTQFCKKHSIPRCSIFRVLNGMKKDWKGWTIFRI